jgi:hypothetical protein
MLLARIIITDRKTGTGTNGINSRGKIGDFAWKKRPFLPYLDAIRDGDGFYLHIPCENCRLRVRECSDADMPDSILHGGFDSDAVGVAKPQAPEGPAN